jgi:hypothetical protein
MVACSMVTASNEVCIRLFLLHITCGTHLAFSHYIMNVCIQTLGLIQSVIAVIWYQSHERLGTATAVSLAGPPGHSDFILSKDKQCLPYVNNTYLLWTPCSLLLNEALRV